MTILLLFSFFKITSFTTYYPERGKTPENKAEIKIDVKEKDIVIDFQVTSKNILSKNLTRDRRLFGEDEFSIILTFDKNSGRGFFFSLNPLNNQTDARIYNFNKLEKLWDEKWFSEVYIKDSLWGGKIKLPLRIFKELIDTSFYLNFSITTHTKNNDIEIFTWNLIPEGFKSYDIRFTKKIPLNIKIYKKTFFSIIPYSAGFKEKTYFLKAGSDLKVQRDFLNTQFTINPEYASIEADVDQFNLDKRRMIYLPEKRPFFIEGLDLWKMPFEAFYTRSILDIDGGGKANLNFKNLNINTLWILEKDTLNKKTNFKNSTYALRSFYNFKKFGAGVFYIRRKFKEEGMGTDANLYLPGGFSLNSQFTYAKGKDIMVYLERFSGKGFWINSGFEYLDSLFDLSTAYIAYYKNTFSYWLYSGYTWSYKRGLFSEYSISAGGTDSYFLDKKPFERYGSISFSFTPVSQIEASFSIEPEKRFYEEKYYENMIYRFSSAFGVNYPHSIIFITEFGKYYGDYLNYHYINYDFLIFKRLRGRINYGISKTGYEEDKRIIFKLTYNPFKRIFIKTFYQKSTISDREDLNLLFQYEFFAGSNIYFVYNYKKIQSAQENLGMFKIAYEFKF